MSEPEALTSAERRARLVELALLFLRLGSTSFGGPAAHVAFMEDEVVRRRKWLSREELLDLYGAANLVPGPNSTELAIHIGHRRAGFAGLLVAGTCFIVPAALLTGAIAWAYVRYGSLPQAGSLTYGIKPVIIAVVIQALVAFARTALKTRLLAAVAGAGVFAAFLGGNELAVLLASGAVVALARPGKAGEDKASPPGAPALLPILGLGAGGAAATAAPFGLGPLFLFFLKVGSILFGSGYVLLAFLRADLVDRFRWLTEAELLDAVAVGQFTPGPVLTTATFIGYLLARAPGAAVATIGIFLPAFFFVAVSGPLVPRLRRSPAAGAFLDGVNAGSLALMAAVTWQLGRAAIIDVPSAILAAVSAFVLLRWKPNTVWIVLAGGLAGVLIHLLRGAR